MKANPCTSITGSQSSIVGNDRAVAQSSTRRAGIIKCCGIVLALIAVGGLKARASDPAGIYALVTKVVIEPNVRQPQTIQIFGAFVMAKGHGYEYDHAHPGYLYYKLKPGAETTCRKEWNDLRSVAGTGQIVGFASRYADQGRLRKTDEKASAPDVYPIAWGITKIRDGDYEPIRELMKFRDSHGGNKVKIKAVESQPSHE
jgi:hypothetical protein